MTDLSPEARALMDAYDRALFTDYDIGDRAAIAAVLRCLIEKCNEPRGTGRVDRKHRVVTVKP